jgi:hypothetical protein
MSWQITRSNNLKTKFVSLANSTNLEYYTLNLANSQPVLLANEAIATIPTTLITAPITTVSNVVLISDPLSQFTSAEINEIWSANQLDHSNPNFPILGSSLGSINPNFADIQSCLRFYNGDFYLSNLNSIKSLTIQQMVGLPPSEPCRTNVPHYGWKTFNWSPSDLPVSSGSTTSLKLRIWTIVKYEWVCNINAVNVNGQPCINYCLTKLNETIIPVVPRRLNRCQLILDWFASKLYNYGKSI